MSDISVILAAPYGLTGRVAVTFQPKTMDEFEAYLEALGGVLAARYIFEGSIHFSIDGGKAYLEFPEDLKPPSAPPSPGQAFAAQLMERQTTARDLMGSLEDAAAPS